MNFSLSEEQELLQETVRGFVAKECPPQTVRAIFDGKTELVPALAELIGVERILFGSDWPHGEGVTQPLDFAKELSMFGEAQARRIMRDNAVELLGSAPR